MSVNTVTEINNTHIPFGQVENQLFSAGTFRKQFVNEIFKTEASCCNISFSDFDNIFKFTIVNITWDRFSNEILFKLDYLDIFSIQLKLNGYWELKEKEELFQLNDVDWNFEEQNNNPTSAYFLNTFQSMLCLSDKVKVDFPAIDYYFNISVPLPLNSISDILQNRQIAYRLMVIEKAMQVSLPFPKSLTGEEVGNIAYCFHAIFDREFDWLAKPQLVPWVSNEEYLSLLPATSEPTTITFESEFVVKSIFGIEIKLGFMMARIEKCVIDNYAEAKENLLKLDGSIVEIKQRSVDGLIKIIAIDVPELPPNPWSKKLQKLIDLDKVLDSKYFNKYLNSFANAFEGLTDEQSQAITERPTLEDKAFNF
ncbi:MAG: hypothetical protein LUM44_19200 [Pyrinomonadaceae bacterium]|nr:hypothetical protein [Pyrinomonadaceae bacterium]